MLPARDRSGAHRHVGPVPASGLPRASLRQWSWLAFSNWAPGRTGVSTGQGGPRVRRLPRRQRPRHPQLRPSPTTGNADSPARPSPPRSSNPRSTRSSANAWSKQQMRSSPRGAHLLLQIRTRVLNDTLADLYRRWYPGSPTQPIKSLWPRSLPRFVPLSYTGCDLQGAAGSGDFHTVGEQHGRDQAATRWTGPARPGRATGDDRRPGRRRRRRTPGTRPARNDPGP